jgi:hypothetical protein
VGPDFCNLRSPAELDPGRAKLIVEIDGDRRVIDVLLHKTVTESNARVEFSFQSQQHDPFHETIE